MSNKKKMEVLYFVEQYIKRYGYPPTVRDIVLSGKLNDVPSGRLFRADLGFLQMCQSL